MASGLVYPGRLRASDDDGRPWNSDFWRLIVGTQDGGRRAAMSGDDRKFWNSCAGSWPYILRTADAERRRATTKNLGMQAIGCWAWVPSAADDERMTADRSKRLLGAAQGRQRARNQLCLPLCRQSARDGCSGLPRCRPSARNGRLGVVLC